MTNLIPHSLGFNQLSEDTVIGGKRIPKGYCNLTQMCKVNKKKLNDYLRLNSSKVYLDALSLDTGIPVDSVIPNPVTGIPVTGLIEVFQGGIPEIQGTWGHHLVATDLARWISPKFAVAANKIIWAVMQGEFSALTEDAQKAKDELDKLWQEIRTAGKVTRRSFTDAIKDWYDRNPNGTSRPIHSMIAIVTNDTYKALWGMDAIQIENVLGCNRNESRNHLSSECLKVLDRAEARVIEFIDDDNVKPSNAVEMANIKKSKIGIIIKY